MTREQQIELNHLVWVNPERLSGEPCFNGTQVPAQTLLDHLEGRSTIDDFLDGFPSVSREQVVRFLELAKDNLIACVSS